MKILSDEEYAALSPIEKAQYKKAYNKEHGISSGKERIPIKAYKDAIRAFCLHCVGDSRHHVAHCTSYNCPLYALRPYKK